MVRLITLLFVITVLYLVLTKEQIEKLSLDKVFEINPNAYERAIAFFMEGNSNGHNMLFVLQLLLGNFYRQS